jgi:hypothetical protein
MIRLIRIFSGRRAAAAITVVALAASGVALAFWVASGSGSASGSVGTLAAPTAIGVSSPAGSSTVSVSWTASEPVGGLSPTGYYVRRWSGSTPAVAGGTCGSAASPVNQTSCTDSSVPDGTYTYTVVAVYHSWTAGSGHSGAVTVAHKATPPVTTLTSNPASPEGSNNWFTRASVGFTLSASSPGSGVAETLYEIDGGPQHTYSGEVTISTQGDHTVTYWSVDKEGNEESHNTAHLKLDDVAPATTIALEPSSPNGSTGWYKTSPTFTLGASDASAGVASTHYRIDSGTEQTYAGSAVSVPEGQHTVSYWSVDNAGNTETAHTSTVKVDTTRPTDALSLGAPPSHALLSGSTLYFGSAVTGSFTLVDTVGDSGSGPASATFPLVSASNWTHAAQTVTTPSGGPYTSSTYSWSAGAGTPSGAESSFTSSDIAGNASNGSSLSFVADAAAPTGGAVSVNGTAATTGGSTSTSTETGFAIGSRSDYTETQSPSQSGLASSTLTIQSETLTGNTCGAPGSGGKYTTATTISGTTNPTIETGFCYLYTLTGTDNVGNAASVKTTVKVDTTGPSSPTVTLSAATGSTFISGTTAFINPQAGKEGSFKVAGASSDAQTGVTSIALPSLTGFSEGGGTLSSPFETKYKWTGAVGASGAQSATATNGVGLTTTNSSAFTVTSDTTAPSGGSVSVPGRVNTASVAVTFSAGSDAGSGINAASGELLRAEATYTGSSDSCGSFGSFAKVGLAGPSSPATDATVVTGKCYEYEYKVSDNVGNATTYGPSGPVKVNTSGPALTAIASTNGNAILETGDTLTLTFSDQLNSSSIPTSGTVLQKKNGGGAKATIAITGITAGTEGWSTGVSSGYQTEKTESEFNETASVSGATVTVTVGSKVKGTTPIAGTTAAATGTVNAAIKDVFENAASTGTFSISAKFW